MWLASLSQSPGPSEASVPVRTKAAKYYAETPRPYSSAGWTSLRREAPSHIEEHMAQHLLWMTKRHPSLFDSRLSGASLRLALQSTGPSGTHSRVRAGLM